MESDDFDPSLDHYESLELGLCHEIIPNEVYLPCHKSRGWIRCCVEIQKTTTFRMYLEGEQKRLLLSAKIFENIVYISSHEDFPLLEECPQRGYFAKIVPQKNDQIYLMKLNYCHHCDYQLGLFTCGRNADEREVMAKISFSNKIFFTPDSELDFRCISVSIPTVFSSKHREIWCPRTLVQNNSKCFQYQSGSFIDALNTCSDLQIKFVNPLPVWSTRINSLVLKFQGNRVLSASAKNFLLFAEKYAKKSSGKKDKEIQDESKSKPSPKIIPPLNIMIDKPVTPRDEVNHGSRPSNQQPTDNSSTSPRSPFVGDKIKSAKKLFSSPLKLMRRVLSIGESSSSPPSRSNAQLNKSMESPATSLNSSHSYPVPQATPWTPTKSNTKRDRKSQFFVDPSTEPVNPKSTPEKSSHGTEEFITLEPSHKEDVTPSNPTPSNPIESQPSNPIELIQNDSLVVTNQTNTTESISSTHSSYSTGPVPPYSVLSANTTLASNSLSQLSMTKQDGGRMVTNLNLSTSKYPSSSKSSSSSSVISKSTSSSKSSRDGKVSKKHYKDPDFRYPLSPIQAFGIATTSFMISDKPSSPKK